VRRIAANAALLYPSKRTLIDGIEKSASCHECDDVSNARLYAPGQILQFFEIAWQIIAWTHLKSDDGHVH
jgi:hypothetical protein